MQTPLFLLALKIIQIFPYSFHYLPALSQVRAYLPRRQGVWKTRYLNQNQVFLSQCCRVSPAFVSTFWSRGQQKEQPSVQTPRLARIKSPVQCFDAWKEKKHMHFRDMGPFTDFTIAPLQDKRLKPGNSIWHCTSSSLPCFELCNAVLHLISLPEITAAFNFLLSGSCYVTSPPTPELQWECRSGVPVPSWPRCARSAWAPRGKVLGA